MTADSQSAPQGHMWKYEQIVKEGDELMHGVSRDTNQFIHGSINDAHSIVKEETNN